MKKNFLFRSCLVAAVALTAAACSDDADLGKVDTDKLNVPDGSVVYVTDAEGKRKFSSIEFRDATTTQLWVHSPKAVAADCNVTFAYDPSVLADYNSANATEYKAVPQGVVSFAGNGSATIAAGTTTASVEYTLTSDGSLTYTDTYVLPLRVTISGGAQLGKTDETRLIFVRDLSNLPDATKYVNDGNGNMVEGVKMFNCIEVNGTNPLCTMAFTLDRSGKHLYDAVILFSSNINFDSETGRVYIFHNENVQHVLDNADKYLRPLKERGIKVILSVLGNHDKSGVANLSDATAKDFAKQIKNCCDAYDLDGVMLDDEYSDYETNPVPPGFVAPSVDALSRLFYEIKKVQPERLNITYAFARAAYMNPVRDLETGELVNPGDYVDFAFANYPDTPTSNPIINNYAGISNRQLGYCSMQFAQGGSYLWSKNALQSTYAAGYGCHLVFAMSLESNTFPATNNDRFQALGNAAEVFYGESIVWDGNTYGKDW